MTQCLHLNQNVLVLVKILAHYGNTGCQVLKGGIQNWKDFCLKAFVFKGSPLTAADLGSYLNFAGKNIDVFKSDRPLKFRYSEKALKI